MVTQVTTRPVGQAALPDLARLFGGQRSTERCWCTAFCSTRSQFAAGWLTGRNRRRFEDVCAADPAPMGVLACRDDEPVGWAACGPRSRYTPSMTGRGELLRTRPRVEDDTVWLLPCLVVAPAHRGQGLTRVLVRAAVDLARGSGARALEGWPLGLGVRRPGDAFVGRQSTYEALGFTCVDSPRPDRVVMRLDLRAP